MSFRYMRLILFFDLPVQTSSQQKTYRHFRKKLISEGFIMEQYSVYSKLVLNKTAANTYIRKMKGEIPKDGVIQVLTITEHQYASMEFFLGERQTEILDKAERMTIW